MSELLYRQSSFLISGLLLVSMVVAIEVGYRIGRTVNKSANESTKAHVSAIQASLLGVLALLLGFTFSLALQRFDSRSEAVVEEANAIGTAYLRAHLLPISVRSDVKKLLQSYVNLRVQAGAISIANEAEHRAILAKTDQVKDTLWDYARLAAEEDGNPVRTGLFIQSLNEAIDSFGRRYAELTRHVPEVVLLLLYGTFVITGGVVGYATGFAGHRPSVVTYIFITLIVILTFIIIDLDRPRRGLIKVDQRSLVELKKAIDEEQTISTQQVVPPEMHKSAVKLRR
jgi:hypothetical protein